GSSHDRSGSLAQSPSIKGMSVVKLRDRVASKFGAMSRFEASTPVSMMPTRTSWLPCSTASEPVAVARTYCMSHCSAANGSAVTSLAVCGAAAAWVGTGDSGTENVVASRATSSANFVRQPPGHVEADRALACGLGDHGVLPAQLL